MGRTFAHHHHHSKKTKMNTVGGKMVSSSTTSYQAAAENGRRGDEESATLLSLQQCDENVSTSSSSSSNNNGVSLKTVAYGLGVVALACSGSFVAGRSAARYKLAATGMAASSTALNHQSTQTLLPKLGGGKSTPLLPI